MGEAAKKESSMEDILASIRRIIHSETSSAPKSAAPAKTEPTKIEPTMDLGQAGKESAPTSSYRSNSLAELVQMNKPAATAPSSIKEQPISSNPTGSLAELKASVLRETVAEPIKQPSQSLANSIGQEQNGANPPLRSFVENTNGQKMAAKPTSGPTFQQIANAAARAAGNEQSPRHEMSNAPLPAAKEQLEPISAPADSIHEVAKKSLTIEATASPLELKAAPSSFAKFTEAVTAETISVPPTSARIVTPGIEPVDRRVVEPSATPKAESVETKFKEALVAPSTSEAVSTSMRRLQKSVADVDAAQVESILRPMLKEWLDSNLPNLVEKIVRQEIERISRGA